MKMSWNSRGLMHAALIICFAACNTGCSTTDSYTVNAAPLAQWPAHRQIQGKVTLRIAGDLADYKFEEELIGGSCVYPFGPALAANSEASAKQAFTEVTVLKGSAPAPGLTLTPQVESQVRAFEEKEIVMTLDLLWTLTDANGEIVWAKTVRGVGRQAYGNQFTFSKDQTKLADTLLKDVFARSLATLTESADVRRLVEEKQAGRPVESGPQ